MATIEAFELETFRHYRLDAESVRLYRLRLACEPPLPLKVLRAQKRRLANLVKKISSIHKQIEVLTEEMWVSRVTWTGPDDICIGGGFECPFTGMGPEPSRGASCMKWNLEEGRWGEGCGLDEAYAPEEFSRSESTLLPPSATRYTQRPDDGDALRAWNLFLVAFRREPNKMAKRNGYRTESERVPSCYCAEYLDRNGKPVTIEEVDIRQARKASPKETVAIA